MLDWNQLLDIELRNKDNADVGVLLAEVRRLYEEEEKWGGEEREE